MPLYSKGENSLGIIREQATGIVTDIKHSVNIDELGKRTSNKIIFNRGGGSRRVAWSSRFGTSTGASLATAGQFAGSQHGEYLFLPNTDFWATIHLWGAGGGIHSSGHNPTGGGGGYARGNIYFEKNIPYILWVGQGGVEDGGQFQDKFMRGIRFGGGGRGHHTGGGGGLSGVFYNSFGGHNASHHDWSPTKSPSQSRALIIAGGGGGGGHGGGNSHHAQGGGGGGLTANSGHNANGATQNAGGNAWGHSAQNGYALHGGHSGGSHSGGGGGGWFGGGGGTHHSNHYNGGGGGSGHSVDISEPTHPNHSLRFKVNNSYHETAPGSHGNFTGVPAQQSNTYRQFAGHGGNYPNFGSAGEDGRIVIELLHKDGDLDGSW
jgi:hypothetical protein